MRGRVVALGCAALAAMGCDLVLGLDHPTGKEAGTGATSGAAGSATGATGGTAGAAGSGMCKAGDKRSCYSGPKGTDLVMPCKAGTQVCKEDGSGFEDCVGEVLPKPETCATKEDDDCNGADCAIWSTIFGDMGDPSILDLTEDLDGNVILLGSFQGAMTVGDTMLDAADGQGVLLVKLDPDGMVLWARMFGGAATTYFSGHVAADPNGAIVLAGSFDGTISFGGNGLMSAGETDIFAAKLNAKGDHVWSTRIGDAKSQEATDLVVDGAGDAIVVGGFKGTFAAGIDSLSSNGVYDDAFAIKLAGNGGYPSWAKGFGDDASQTATAVSLDKDGNVILIGPNSGTVNFGGDDLIETTPSSADFYIAKLNGLNGAHLWSKEIVADSYLYVTSIAVTNADDVILGGSFSGTLDLGGGGLIGDFTGEAFLAKFADGGSHLWSKRFGSASKDSIESVTVGSDGSIFVAAVSDGSINFGGEALFSAGNKDVFVATLDAKGDHVWSRGFGDRQIQQFPVVSANVAGRLIVGCETNGLIDFGNGSLAATGQVDIAVASLAP